MNKTWISTTGEVFEGGRNELMRAKGIKCHKGFSRPAGAVDAEGDRWLSEDKYNEQGGIKKQKLHLNPRWIDKVLVAPHDIAINYSIAKNVVENKPEHPRYTDYQELMATVEAQYDVIDNSSKVPVSEKKLAPRSARIQFLLDKNEGMDFDTALDIVMNSETIAISNGYSV